MKENPANSIPDSMWDFLKDGGLPPDPNDFSVLKAHVRRLDELITKQQTADGGLADFRYGGPVELAMRLVVMDAMTLVLSGQIGG